MPPKIAAIVFVVGILGLFVLDREKKSRTSKALWIPVMWILIVASRPLSTWLQFPPPDGSDPYLDGSPFDRFVFICLELSGLIVLILRSRQVGSLLRRNGPIVLFFFFCGLSIFWADYPFVAFKRWIKGLGDVVMILIVLTDLEPKEAIKRLFARVSFLLIPFSVMLIKYFPEMGRAYRRFEWTPVYTGVTTGKNLLGMTCLMCGLASLWRFLQAVRGDEGTRKKGTLVAHGALLLMVFWLFWMADSVSSLSCFALAGGLMVMTRLSAMARRPVVVHALMGAVLAASLSVLFLNIGTGVVEELGRDPTLTGRTKIWSLVLPLNENPLVGTGFESFWLGNRLQKIWSVYWWQPNEAHNGYLEVYLNLGWIGVTLLALLLVTGYRNLMAAFRRDQDIGNLKLAFFVTAVVYNCTESAIRILNPVWILFLLAIMVTPSTLVSEEPPPFEIHYRNHLPESELEVDHVLRVGLPRGAI